MADETISFADAMGGGDQPPTRTKLSFAEATDQQSTTASPPISATSDFGAHIRQTIVQIAESLGDDPRKYSDAGGGLVKATVGGIVGLGEASVAGLMGLANLARRKGKGGVGTAVEGIEASQQFTAEMRQIGEKIAGVNLAPENKQEQAMNDLLMLLPEGIHAAGETTYEKFGNAAAAAGIEGVLTLLTLKPGIVTRVFKGSPKIAAVIDELALKDPKSAEALADHIGQADKALGEKVKIQIAEAKAEPAKTGEAAGREETTEAPAIPAGYTRFYHGGSPETVTGSLWFTADLRDAQGWASRSKDMKVWYVDVPNGTKGVDWGDIENGMPMSSRQELPAELANQRKPLKANIEEGLSIAASDITADLNLGEHRVSVEGGEILAQESGKYLQVKRADVIAAERGKGKAQEMMAQLFERAQDRSLILSSDVTVSPDAQRVYASLQKRGFSIHENPSSINPETGSKVSADPRVPVYEVLEAPRSIAAEAQATQIFSNGPALSELPGAKFAEGKLKAWYDEIIRTINPEALGAKAKMAASVLANKIAEQMHRDSTNWGRSAERRKFWSKNAAQVREFMARLETGKPQIDAVMEKAAENIRQRNRETYEQDSRNAIQYDPIDNYLYHSFEDSESVAGYFQRKYGAKWGDPKFTKDRAFDLYEEAIKAGFKPRFTNPEEIMLARQHASDVAEMRVGLLRDMETYGLASEITKANPDPPKGGPSNYRRSPNGKGYWVDAQADAVLHNFFDTKSLWDMKGIRGDVFRSAMFLKNILVPIKLALSLFHPLHVATIDNATGMVRATKELLSGTISPLNWTKQVTQATLYKGFISSPRLGYRLLKAYKGDIDPTTLTPSDKLSLSYMAEGGMIPEMSAQFKTKAIESFSKALQERSAKAIWHAPFAAISLLQKPMFEIWIPSLKIASYLKDVQTAVKVNPELITDKGQRLLAFRRLAKSIDNRYGEMAYNTLFWNKMVKDIAVANTLSLGWQLGFIREYGGGMLDIGQSVTRAGRLATKAQTGMLDRPLFVMFYTTQALMYGGLLTWALTGSPPTSLMDYIYPKSGNKNEKGEDDRLNTMFYPREFAAISKHIEHQGLIEGLSHLVASKASGLIGMVSEWATGLNSFDQEIRDPNAPLNQQIQQTLKATLIDLEPISVGAARQGSGSVKDTALAFAGFNKAPKYVTQSTTEALVTNLYRKYNAPRQTPYEKALLSSDTRKLKQLYLEGNITAYGDLLDQMQEKYQLTAKDQMRLARTVLHSQDINPIMSMFQRLTWQQQKRVLDQMSDAERDEYLPFSNRDHLRFTYEPPETK